MCIYEKMWLQRESSAIADALTCVRIGSSKTAGCNGGKTGLAVLGRYNEASRQSRAAQVMIIIFPTIDCRMVEVFFCYVFTREGKRANTNSDHFLLDDDDVSRMDELIRTYVTTGEMTYERGDASDEYDDHWAVSIKDFENEDDFDVFWAESVSRMPVHPRTFRDTAGKPFHKHPSLRLLT